MHFVIPVGSERIRLQCVRNASRSDGSRETKAAMRFASGSLWCSKIMGRSLSATSRRIIELFTTWLRSPKESCESDKSSIWTPALLSVRNAPHPALLRIAYIERAIGSHRFADWPIFRRTWHRAGLIETCKPIREDFRISRLPFSIERHEHHVISVLVARAVQDDERAAAILGREFLARIE